MSRQADSDQPEAKQGWHDKMFPARDVEQDGLTSWERFERLAKQVFSVKKSDIDVKRPASPRKTKRA